MTAQLIEAVRRAGRLGGHLETGEDQRPVFTTGRLDPTNVYYTTLAAARSLETGVPGPVVEPAGQ